MSYTLTDEQQNIIDSILERDDRGKPVNKFISVSARAGTSKSYTAVQIAETMMKQYPKSNIRYLVYNSANAIEAKQDFGNNATVSTIHSMAYKSIIPKMNQERKMYDLPPIKIRSYLNYRSLPDSIRLIKHDVHEIIYVVEVYCKSKFYSFSDFVEDYNTFSDEEDQLPEWLVDAASELLGRMALGECDITHDFYLKLFHERIMTGKAGYIHEVDLLCFDEVQDANPIMLNIFDKYPAKQKLIIGDEFQSIYAWNGCINGFNFLNHRIDKELELSKSFRVDKTIATAVEKFMQDNVNEDFIFRGMDYPDNPKIGTTAHICRTNSSVIEEMIKCKQTRKPYRLVSKSKLSNMFKLPKALIFLKPGFNQMDDDLKPIQQDINTWGKDKLIQKSFPSKFQYLMHMHPNNQELKRSIKLVLQYGPELILSIISDAESHLDSTASHTICTGHVSKGLTFDSVYIDNDMNKAIESIVEKIESDNRYIPDPTEKAELFLYYIACTRPRHKLENAKFLDL